MNSVIFSCINFKFTSTNMDQITKIQLINDSDTFFSNLNLV